ncbi:MAG: hypothetical protein PHF00_13315, partial [Elusimicrobia bacterium]|nr:hypothetical protein [Elusimicrobiota bacterium]
RDPPAPEPRRADFSALMSFYVAHVLRGQGLAGISEDDLQNWGRATQRYLVEQSRAASLERIHRIADRIVNLNPDPKVRGGEREWIIDPQTKERVKLIDSSVMARHGWLRETLLRASQSQAETGRAIGTAEDLLRFYQELSAPDIAAVYARGARNNQPWIDIAQAVALVANSQDPASLRHAIDGLRNKVHNTGQSFLEYAPDARQLLEFFDLTRQAKDGEDLEFALRFADPELARRFHDANQSALNQ